jgi:hypothetical protein
MIREAYAYYDLCGHHKQSQYFNVDSESFMEVFIDLVVDVLLAPGYCQASHMVILGLFPAILGQFLMTLKYIQQRLVQTSHITLVIVSKNGLIAIKDELS